MPNLSAAANTQLDLVKLNLPKRRPVDIEGIEGTCSGSLCCVRITPMKIQWKAIIVATMLLAASAIGTLSTFADTNYSLAALSFMCGTWRGASESHSSIVEEYWSEADGNTMIGCYRSIKGSDTTFYELLVIQKVPDGIELKMKHFDRELVGWESKEKAQVCRLTSLSADEATFEGVNEGESTKIVYRKTAPHSMTVAVDIFNVQDKNKDDIKKLRFQFNRLGAKLTQ
ncbi:MAG: DUF6265 family protein [Candidatus Obscuribacterales bacterium]